MSWLAHRLVLRALAREKARLALALFSVALGVGVFLSIRLANRAAVTSFEGFTRGVASGSEFTLRAEAGPLAEADLAALRPALDHVWLAPVVEGSFTRTLPAETFSLLGVDLVGLANTGAAQAGPAALDGGASFFQSLQTPRGVFIAGALARAEGLGPGARLAGFVDGRAVTLEILGVCPDPPGRPPLQRTQLVMDLPAAQDLLGRQGELDRVEVGLLEGVALATGEAALRAHLPPGWSLDPAQQRASSGRTMTAAFRFNLTVLSLIGLAVGAYLLFQTFDAAVARRRETWATLRALGTPPSQVRGLVLLEAALVGTLGSGLGLLVGWGLAQGAVRGVSQTMNALYGAAAARSAALALDEAAFAYALGLGTCLAAAWWPARRAAAVPPVQLLARGSGVRPMAWRPVASLGAGLLGGGALLAFLPHPPPGVAWHAYGGAVLVLVGGSLAAVAALPLLGLLGRWTRHWRARLGLRPLARPTGRHGFAAAALAVAVGMAVGMGVMVQSFEGTVRSWIGESLRADLYLTPQGATGAASRHRLPGELPGMLREDPRVRAVDAFTLQPLRFRGQETFLGAGHLDVHARFGRMQVLAGGPSAELLARLHAEGLGAPGAVASETFARRFGVRVGEVLTLPTPAGPRTLTVRGIYADYGHERGSLIVDQPVLQAWFREARPASLALYLSPGVDPGRLARELALAYPGVQVRSNRALREQVTTIFRQTFALTYALEAIGVAVAVAGLAQALVGLAWARRGELWTLRSLGARPRDLGLILLTEGLGVGLAGCAGGVGLGLVLALILVRVLNPQVFGWTLAFSLPWTFLALLLGLCLAAVVVALAPLAHWTARLGVDRAQEEGA